jgi:hypothetical protein
MALQPQGPSTLTVDGTKVGTGFVPSPRGGFALSCLARLRHPRAAAVSICGPTDLIS